MYHEIHQSYPIVQYSSISLSGFPSEKDIFAIFWFIVNTLAKIGSFES